VGRDDSYDWEVFVREQICMALRPRCGTWAKDLERGPEEVFGPMACLDPLAEAGLRPG
jgi:hypothetical protein